MSKFNSFTLYNQFFYLATCTLPLLLPPTSIGSVGWKAALLQTLASHSALTSKSGFRESDPPLGASREKSSMRRGCCILPTKKRCGAQGLAMHVGCK